MSESTTADSLYLSLLSSYIFVHFVLLLLCSTLFLKLFYVSAICNLMFSFIVDVKRIGDRFTS